MSHAWAIINKEMEKEHGKYTTSYQDTRSVGEKTSVVFFIANNYSLTEGNRYIMLLEFLINKTIKKVL